MSEATKEHVVKIGWGPLWVLTLIFVVAKITGHLDWTWWVVFSPLWGPPAAVLALFGSMLALAGLLFAVIVGVLWGLDQYDSWKLRRRNA